MRTTPVGLVMLNDERSHVHARLDCPYDEFLKLFPCNHVIGAPGELTGELVAFCELTGVTPVLCGPRGRDRVEPIWEKA